MTLQPAPLGRIRRRVPSAFAKDASVALGAFALTLLMLRNGTATRNLDPLGWVLAAIST